MEIRSPGPATHNSPPSERPPNLRGVTVPPRNPVVWWSAWAAVAAGMLGVTLYLASPGRLSRSDDGVVEARPTATLLVAIHDLARLETTELHMEKVVDLTDRQSRFFGLIETTDALLLVAAGDVTLGVDLSKIRDEDITTDSATSGDAGHLGSIHIALPEPQILSSRLDEGRTYVYTRKTDLLARRNEHLESRARKEAIAALEKGADEPEVKERAKRQAERQLVALLSRLSGQAIVLTWR